MLDNFEHLLDSAPLVADLLMACTGLQIIVTSRAALHVRGEREFPVPPLALPDRRALLDAEALRGYAAVSLFIERALAVKPDFAVTAETARDVSEICARLDGLPLAIELAAARSKLLSPAVMLARLERRLPLLSGGARDLPERQRTLRGTIAWSYDLLTEPERLLFRRLSVFVGGWDLETIEGMWSDVSDIATLDLVASLVDKNLLRQAEALGAEARFEMLETIREYGLEVLHQSESWKQLNAATRSTSLPWLRRLSRTFRAKSESTGYSAWNRNTTISAPPSAGAWTRPDRAKACAWPPRSGSSGSIAAISVRAAAGFRQCLPMMRAAGVRSAPRPWRAPECWPFIRPSLPSRAPITSRPW